MHLLLRNYSHFMKTNSIFRCSKVFGQSKITVDITWVLILGWRSFADVTRCCLSSLEKLHQTFTITTFSCTLFSVFLCSVFSSETAKLTDLTIKAYPSCLPSKSWFSFTVCFGFSIHLHYEAPSYQFCSIWLNVSRQYSPIHLRIPLAISFSSHFINVQ